MSRPLCVFVTLDAPVGHLIDDQLCEPHFQEQGWELQSWVWTQPQDWTRPQLIVVRSCYDYWERPEQFVQFLRALDEAPGLVLNPTSLLNWNLNKRYLFQLERLGIPTIPSLLLEPAKAHEQAESFLQQHPQVEEFVVKPLVAAGGFAMQKLDRKDLADLKPDAELLLQPFLDSIHQGEWSALFFNGRPSHSVCKTPRSGEYRVQDCHGGSTRPTPWDELPGLKEAALRVSSALGQLGLPTPCYARYDFLPHQDRLLLMEAELIEPTLFLAEHPPAAREFVQVLLELESFSNQQGETLAKNERAILAGRPPSSD